VGPRRTPKALARRLRHTALVWQAGLLALLLGLGCTASPATTCSAGTPGCTVCDDHHLDCNGKPEDGCESEPSHDSLNCGRCGKACPGITQNKGLCIEGECGLCPAGTLDCNGRGSDGCEKHIESDPQNCGVCGRVCPEIANGVPGCLLGSCGLDHCKAGFQDCNSDPVDGCETNVQADVKNCGNCGAQCPTLPGGAVVCQDGACVIGMCKMGFDSCEPGPLQYCQTSLLSNEDHCGKCGVACPTVPSLQRACIAGACTGIPCQPNWKDCDSNATTGCETNINKDAKHCGGCNQACSPSNATGGCVNAECRIFSCNIGSGNCNGSVADGCEANLKTDINNCGVCNARCINPQNATGVTCAAGQCEVVTCTKVMNAMGRVTNQWADCDGLYNNGCEVDLKTSLTNCGYCNSPCPKVPHATGTCEDGVCQPAKLCDPGWADCNRLAADGCETDITADPSNCGSCGTLCQVVQRCVNKSCVDLAM
jgi:hypothetical protein